MGATSTETLTSWEPPPVMIPLTGLTSLKSRPRDGNVLLPGIRLLVGSKSTQPIPGQRPQTRHARRRPQSDAAVPRRTRPQIAADVACRHPNGPSRHAMARWAKSWQTPRRFVQTSSTGVVTVVATGSYLKSVKIRRVKSRTPIKTGVSGSKLGRA